jgi:hypothetical protein
MTSPTGHRLFFGQDGYRCECGWKPCGAGFAAEANHRDHLDDVSMAALARATSSTSARGRSGGQS